MWKPAEVLPKDKSRAVALFAALLLGIITYSGYLIYEAVDKRKNPSASFVLSNQLYKYPDIDVCFYESYGCDDEDTAEECMDSAFGTAAGHTSAVFNPDGETKQEIVTRAMYTQDRGYCVIFEASKVKIAGKRDPEDFILLNMYWYPGGAANASTTCISEQGAWDSHSESVFMFLRDPGTGVLSAGVQVAYSCMTSESNSHVFTYVGIGLTKEYKITGDDSASYTALSTSSVLHKDKRTANITGIVDPYAWLSFEIAQSTNSLMEIRQIDPLEVAEMFGNVGGFWDLLLILWPIFFVTASRQQPHLKVRNFKKAVVRGSERAVGSIGASIPRPLRRQWSERPDSSRGEGERAPSWDSGRGGPMRQDLPVRKFSYRSASRAAPSHSTAKSDAAATNTSAPPLTVSSARWRRPHALASSARLNPHGVRSNSGMHRSRSSPFRINGPRVAQDKNSNRNSRNADRSAVSEDVSSSTVGLSAADRSNGCRDHDGGDGGGGGGVRRRDSDDGSPSSISRDLSGRRSGLVPFVPALGATVGDGSDIRRSGGSSSSRSSSKSDNGSDNGSRNGSGRATSGPFVV